MFRRRPAFLLISLSIIALWATKPRAQTAATAVARPIDPGGIQLPPESESANETKFSFIAYGDTRGPADGYAIQPAHRDVINRILEVIPQEQSAGFPVRFVVQSGDAVVGGQYGEQWNVSFNPLVERLIHDGHVPYFFAIGNHDVGLMPVHSAEWEAGLRNTTIAMSHLWPPERSPRRLDGHPTFAFGYGHFFFILFDSTNAADGEQFGWVKKQLESLDRQRYRQVIAVFHHPLLSSGPHGGPLVERESQVLRQRYLPLFRAHHVRMTLTGHDHLFDHFIEHYDDRTGTHRMDHIVSGGGGAPIYSYRGEPDLHLFEQTSGAQHLRVDHPVRPGVREADNPHHFLIFEVDGDQIWLQVVATIAAPFLPHGQPKIELTDSR